MSVNIYLTFDGDCREAVMFYADAFQTAKPKIMTFGEAPPNPEFKLPEEAKDLVMHTRLNINGTEMMFSDTFPGTPYNQGNNFSLTVVSKDIDEIKSYFNKMKQGATVEMDLQETFWSKCYGKLTDKFGVGWQFSHEGSE
ncbi:MAG TPA: VOC family protein [Cerasibacillus sp.]|uniref:VOC family protein n=1 Tax=Cerasibacillus sp. TaxID=2498711 RepID=UPI002F3EE93C